jgi:hypothetical protein
VGRSGARAMDGLSAHRPTRYHPSMPALRAHLAAALLLIGLTGLVHAPLVSLARAPYSPFSDVLAEHLALKHVAHEHGSFTLWRTDQFSGAPALTNPQALFLHPLHGAFWFLQPEAAVGPSFLLAFWLAALGCYALARTLGAGWLAGLFSGTAGLSALKLILAAHAGWLAPLATLATVPWLIAGLLRCAERPDATRTLQLAWISLLAFAGGSPQLLYYVGLLFVPFAAMRGGRAFGLSAGALAAGLLCNAYLWLPIASDWPWLGRTQASGDYASFLSGHALGWNTLRSLLLPGLEGPEPWEAEAYFGWLPLGLAVLGAARSPARSAHRYAAFACAASLVLSLDTPLTHAAYAALPGYASFRLPGRMLFLTTFLGVALAGAGLQRWLGAHPRMRACALAGIAALCLEGNLRSAASLTTVPVAELLPDPTHPLRGTRLRPRAAVVGRRTLNYGWSAALDLRLINGYDPYNYAHAKRLLGLIAGDPAPRPSNWFDLKQIARPDLLDELAVRYLIASAPLSLPQLRLVSHHDGVRNFVFYRGMQSQPLYLYENLGARPYARFAGPPDPSARVQLERASPGSLALRAEVAQRALLVVAETFHPGWRVRIDGRSATPLQVNQALLGTWIEPGAHRVELRFVPLHFELGLGLSALGLASLLGLSGWQLTAAGRARRAPPPHRDG